MMSQKAYLSCTDVWHYFSDHVDITIFSESIISHYLFIFHREVFTQVTKEAMSAHPSGRIIQLAEPKKHKMWANSEDTYRSVNSN